jgi:hypothetical protein
MSFQDVAASNATAMSVQNTANQIQDRQFQQELDQREKRKQWLEGQVVSAMSNKDLDKNQRLDAILQLQNQNPSIAVTETGAGRIFFNSMYGNRGDTDDMRKSKEYQTLLKNWGNAATSEKPKWEALMKQHPMHSSVQEGLESSEQKVQQGQATLQRRLAGYPQATGRTKFDDTMSAANMLQGIQDYVMELTGIGVDKVSAVERAVQEYLDLTAEDSGWFQKYPKLGIGNMPNAENIREKLIGLSSRQQPPQPTGRIKPTKKDPLGLGL